MRTSIVLATIFSMTVLPVAPTAFAGPSALRVDPVSLQNVELNADGAVEGIAVDDKGAAIADTVVRIQTKSGASEVRTDSEGKFLISNVAAGNCTITIGEKTYGCRLWVANTAPPKSLTSFVIVHGDGPVVRGQDYCGEGCDTGSGRRGFLGGPLSGGQLLGLGLLAGGIVAIVIAADNDASK